MSDPAGDVLLSLSALAREFECTRETLRKRLASADIQPSAAVPQVRQLTIDGLVPDSNTEDRKVYRLRDVLRAWKGSHERDADPNKLDPFRRRAHFDAAIKRQEWERREGTLIRREDVEAESARVMKAVAQLLDTIPDVLERDVGLPAEAIKRTELMLDQVREELYRDLTSLQANENPDLTAATE